MTTTDRTGHTGTDQSAAAALTLQEGEWHAHHSAGFAYPHTVAIVRLLGKWPERIVRQAISSLKHRHHALRTRYTERDGGLYPSELAATDIPTVTCDGESGASADAGVESLVRALSEEPIDPTESAPFRVHIVRVSKREMLLVFVGHHVATDSLSQRILFRDYSALLLDRMEGRPARVLPTFDLYRDMAVEQRLALQAVEASHRLQQFAFSSEGSCFANLTRVEASTVSASDRLASTELSLPTELLAQLNARGLAERIPLRIVALVCLFVVLADWTGSPSVAVELPSASRPSAASLQTIGLFMTSMLLQAPMDMSLSLRAVGWLIRAKLRDPSQLVQTSALLATRPDCVSKLPRVGFECAGNLGANPTENGPQSSVPGGDKPFSVGVEERRISVFAIEAKILPKAAVGPLRFDLIVRLLPFGSGARLVFEYDRCLLRDSDVKFRMKLMVEMLREFAEEPSQLCRSAIDKATVGLRADALG